MSGQIRTISMLLLSASLALGFPGCSAVAPRVSTHADVKGLLDTAVRPGAKREKCRAELKRGGFELSSEGETADTYSLHVEDGWVKATHVVTVYHDGKLVTNREHRVDVDKPEAPSGQ